MRLVRQSAKAEAATRSLPRFDADRHQLILARNRPRALITRNNSAPGNTRIDSTTAKAIVFAFIDIAIMPTINSREPTGRRDVYSRCRSGARPFREAGIAGIIAADTMLRPQP